jgi:hypothetical protein
MKTGSKALLLILLGLGALAPQAFAQSPGTFTATGNMTTPRGWHTATLLPDGRVLIAGGGDLVPLKALASAELYDPSTGIFTATGNMTVGRLDHTATLLTNGKVLIAGGDGSGQTPSATGGFHLTAELYDPATGTFAATGNMIVDGGFEYAAALLPDGRVLFVAADTDRAAAQIYDPSTGAFAAAATPVAASIQDNSATLLPSGQVLIAQSDELRGELYDPPTNTFFPTFFPRQPWVQGPAVLLLTGEVLMPGGFDDTLDDRSAQATVYDPSIEIFRQTGNMTVIRTYHTATLLPDGTVLIAGGDVGPDINVTTNFTELYNPATGAFTSAADMAGNRELHTATLLNNGEVLVAGGFIEEAYGPVTNSSAELYTPASLIPPPVLFSLSGSGQGQGTIWHSSTGAIVSAGNPAIAGEALSMYTTNLSSAGVVPPQVVVGGQMAQVLYFGAAPGYPGYYQVNFTVPSGLASGPATPVLLSFIGRFSNEVRVAVQ